MRKNRSRGRLGARRRWIQWLAALGSNAYLPGFFLANIYRGSLKTTCIPTLNCYSCPGALFACPLGAAQNAAARGTFPFYVVGFIAAMGALVGRIPCGWLCPFGLFQDLLWRGRRGRAMAVPGALRWAKYGVLALLLPVAAIPSGALNIGYERFCTYLCPSGTLTASIPLLAVDPTLRSLAGVLFGWRLLLLAAVAAVGIAHYYRPFCRTLCPLGAGLGLLNSRSLWRIDFYPGICTDCGACRQACPVDLDPTDGGIDLGECLRCLSCVAACPESALEFVGPMTRKGGEED
ncbi:MAG: 4Fe-4S binding protein [Clostridia bacterium]